MSRKPYPVATSLALVATLAGAFSLAADTRAATDGVAQVSTNVPTTAPSIALQRSAMVHGTAVLTVSGTTVSGCPPRLDAVERHGHELVLASVGGDGHCLAEPQPFALRSGLQVVPGGTLRLRYEHRDNATAPARLRAFRLVDLDDGRPRPTPEAGFWWGEQGGEFDTAGPGFGVQLEWQGDTVALAISGYDDDGAASWLFGAAPLDAQVTTVPLVRLSGGRGPHERFRGPDGAMEAGRVHVEWLGSARAVFWFERPTDDGDGIELQPVSMVRFGFDTGAGEQWLGRWLLGSRQASGDAAVTPRTVDFDRFESTTDGFELGTADGDRMVCRLDPARQGSPPTACRFEAFGVPIIEFDDVALNRLSGKADGAAEPVVLLRLDR